jgi:hypothetical protein
MTLLFLYHVFRCVNELMTNAMEHLIIEVSIYLTLSFMCLILVKCICFYIHVMNDDLRGWVNLGSVKGYTTNWYQSKLVHYKLVSE